MAGLNQDITIRLCGVLDDSNVLYSVHKAEQGLFTIVMVVNDHAVLINRDTTITDFFDWVETANQ